jgi:hypothetical protein
MRQLEEVSQEEVPEEVVLRLLFRRQSSVGILALVRDQALAKLAN